MKTPDDARFIYGKEGNDVVIRHVHPDSCAHTFSKAEVWQAARRAAQPVQGRKKKLPDPGNIFFQDIHGMRTQIA